MHDTLYGDFTAAPLRLDFAATDSPLAAVCCCLLLVVIMYGF
jgi:hypothetical protein